MSAINTSVSDIKMSKLHLFSPSNLLFSCISDRSLTPIFKMTYFLAALQVQNCMLSPQSGCLLLQNASFKNPQVITHKLRVFNDF